MRRIASRASRAGNGSARKLLEDVDDADELENQQHDEHRAHERENFAAGQARSAYPVASWCSSRSLRLATRWSMADASTLISCICARTSARSSGPNRAQVGSAIRRDEDAGIHDRRRRGAHHARIQDRDGQNADRAFPPQ